MYASSSAIRSFIACVCWACFINRCCSFKYCCCSLRAFSFCCWISFSIFSCSRKISLCLASSSRLALRANICSNTILACLRFNSKYASLISTLFCFIILFITLNELSICLIIVSNLERVLILEIQLSHSTLKQRNANLMLFFVILSPSRSLFPIRHLTSHTQAVPLLTIISWSAMLRSNSIM